MNVPYLPGKTPPPQHPLARYLPPLPGGILADFLPRQAPAGAWVCFPFGEAPQQAIEAAALGYRVLVISSNPVLGFLQETLADGAEEAQWQAVLAQLAATRVGEQRLEPYLHSLYHTECPTCAATIPASAFLWRRKASAPHARILTCPHCGTSGLYRTTPADAGRLIPLQRSYGLHSGRALQRVTPPGDDLRPQAEAALQAYLPRALIALFTLLNQAQRLRLPAAQEKRLHALLLAACDHANTLWAHPESAASPRHLKTPPVFIEKNLWYALEEAAGQWSRTTAVPCLHWPQTPPPSGGICLYNGRLREAAQLLPEIPPQALIAPLPRPNAAFWKQAILWSGWLWGRAAIGAWKPLLRRYRYTWEWHTALLSEVWRILTPALPPEIPILGLLAGDDPAWLRAALLSAAHGGLRLHALALRPSAGAQIHWRVNSEKSPPSLAAASLAPIALQGVQQHLEACAESAPWQVLHAAALQALAERGALATIAPHAPEQSYKLLSAALRRNLNSGAWRAAPAQAASPRARRYYLHPAPAQNLSLADRTEMCVVKTLLRSPGSSRQEIESAVCAALPGLLTPESALVQAVLDSYAEQGSEGGYRLREEDAPHKRRADLEAIARLLETLGRRLGARVTRRGVDSPTVRWQPAGESTPYTFHVIASALAGKVIAQEGQGSSQRWIVLPGSRSALLLWKIHRDPALEEALRAGQWGLLKFRHVRRLAATEDLTWESLQARLQLDPFTHEGLQLVLF